MAPAAVRIPGQPSSELEFPSGPRIFVHEGARQALERRLELALARPVKLAVTDNLRRMVSQTEARGSLRVRVHMMFLGAKERVREALVDYVAHGDRRASEIVGEYIEANLHRIRASRPVVGPLRTRGRVHDLEGLLERVSAEYFGGMQGEVLVTWGRRTRPVGEKRDTIKLGSYSAEERLIRVHPVLDRKWVPRYFVSYIVYHELLHHLIPPGTSGRRDTVHPPELLRREREFRNYDRALAWEGRNLARLLRAR
ncbi:MAG TPA: hypothetical protein VF103_04065 [Polyangiaceae bacterium]